MEVPPTAIIVELLCSAVLRDALPSLMKTCLLAVTLSAAVFRGDYLPAAFTSFSSFSSSRGNLLYVLLLFLLRAKASDLRDTSINLRTWYTVAAATVTDLFSLPSPPLIHLFAGWFAQSCTCTLCHLSRPLPSASHPPLEALPIRPSS
jgi:hypothetical protein